MRLIFLLLTALCTCVRAQTIELEPNEPIVIRDGRPLALAWFGGLNAPQFQMTDLDNDGTEDLLIYDRAGQTFLAARSRGNGRYVKAPELLANFPSVQSWMAVRDYDQDGIPDLFTYAELVDGIQVFKGKREPDGLLSFDRLDFGGPDPILYFPFGNIRTSVFVTSIDYPSFEDVDFDGDLDILTFSVVGGFLEYYQNLSVERGFGTDTLIYTLADQCWGGFFESGISTALDLSDEPGSCFESGLLDNPGQARHSGSTVLALDYDGNNLTDVLLGDISFSKLTLGLNNGTREQAWITEQDPDWNSNSVEANIPSFPAAFHVDLDQDGDKDIIGAPTTTLNGEDVNVGWFYENTTSDAVPDFQFRTDKFLVNDMIDLGSRSNVTTFDYDADGRLDIIIGNNNEYTGTNFLDSRLRLFRNITEPGAKFTFELVDEDYLGLSDFMNALWAFTPAFGDLDGDGDEDVVIGERSGHVIYLENEAGAGQPARFGAPVFEWFDMDAGQFSKPAIADLDRDGLNDILIGGFDGRIRFYRNIGTATEPAFDPSTSAPGNALQLGQIDARVLNSSTGHPTPAVVQNEDFTLVFVGNRAGFVEAYRFGRDTAVTDAFTLITERVGDASFGSFANPGFGDFDADGTLEMIVGNERGGVEFFKTNLSTDALVSTFTPRQPDFEFAVSPNPSTGHFIVSGWPRGSVTEVSIHDISGRQVFKRAIDAARTQVPWNGEGQAKGVYLARLTGPGGTATQRIVLQ